MGLIFQGDPPTRPKKEKENDTAGPRRALETVFTNTLPPHLHTCIRPFCSQVFLQNPQAAGSAAHHLHVVGTILVHDRTFPPGAAGNSLILHGQTTCVY